MMDPYDYLKDARFTSELYKVELKNLPKFFGFAELKKFLDKKHHLAPRKIKQNRGSNPHVFINFKNEEEQLNAVEKLNGALWKNSVLSAKIGKPAADPFISAQEGEITQEGRPKKDKKKDIIQKGLLNINDIVTPYWKYQYEDQLKLKDENLAKIVTNQWTPLIRSSYVRPKSIDIDEVIKALNAGQNDISSHQNCEVKFDIESIKASPIITGYRNKCEFTIGYGNDENLNTAVEINEGEKNLETCHKMDLSLKDGDYVEEKVADPVITDGEMNQRNSKPLVIGFRTSTYKSGCNAVASPQACPHVNHAMKSVVKNFQSFLRTLELAPYDPVDKSGVWSQLTLKSNSLGSVMAILHASKPNLLRLVDITAEKIMAALTTQFSFFGVDSLYVQLETQRIHTDVDQGVSNKHRELIHLAGTTHIVESVADMKFRVSPDSFFQINTSAFEVMLSIVGSFLERDQANFLDPATNESLTTVILDVCCGTGTIGQYLAKRMGQSVSVLGIDICEAAIEDARYNAQLNGLPNVRYICRSADRGLEDRSLTMSHDDGDSPNHVVAILDPPRCGVPKKVVEFLRCVSSTRLKSLIYISCDISSTGATKNISDMTRPASKRLPGLAFKITKVIPVDMFPQTPKFETIILLERS